MSSIVRVAAAQVKPVFLDRKATIAKGVEIILEAGRNGAKLVAFPETWVPCYPLWIYGAAGWDDPVSKRVYKQLQENSVAVPSESTDRICEAAKEAGVTVVMGINERDADFSRGTLYNSLLYVSAEGKILGVRRKLMPTHAEKLLWGQGDGSDLQVYDTPIGRVGGAICWEHWMPLNRFAMHSLGEQIHVAAWPEVPELHHLASRHYAFEGRCFVICVGSYLRLEDVPSDFPLRSVLADAGQFGDDPDELLPGGSGVIGPDGNWVVGPISGREEIIYADIDLSLIGEEQFAFDSVGHYNRPDVFQVSIDRRKRAQVNWLDEQDPAARPGGSDATQPG